MEGEREGGTGIAQPEASAPHVADQAGEVPQPAPPADTDVQWWRNDAPGPREVQ